MLSAPIKITLIVPGLFVSSFLQAENMDFARDIQPIFAKHGTTCDGPDEQKGGLNLTEEDSLHSKLKYNSSVVDQPIAALIRDLKAGWRPGPRARRGGRRRSTPARAPGR